MGYNPRTGEELVPITRQVADEWSADEKLRLQEAQRTPPKRIPNPENTVFFDPITGQPKVWYWRSDQGDWEFYDNKGFHPRNGDPLQVVNREVLDRWQRELAEAQQRKKDIEAKARAEADERDRQERQRTQAEAEAKQAAEHAKQQEAQSGNDCDHLAGNPTDARKVGDGVSFDILKLQVDDAIEACTRAVKQFPSELRYQYQLGRAFQLRDRKKAFEIETALVHQRYNPDEGINIFEEFEFDEHQLYDGSKEASIFPTELSAEERERLLALSEAELEDEGWTLESVTRFKGPLLVEQV
jgi:hypothetical protein